MGPLENLGKMVWFHRRKARLSRNQLAHLAGVGKTVIYDVEKGKTSVRLDIVMKILNILNIRVQFESPLMSRFHEESDAASNSAG